MEGSRDLFLRMTEQEYLQIPDEIREGHLRTKIYSESATDWAENMQDETYAKLYKDKKEITKHLNEREYQLRENRRKEQLTINSK